MHFNVLSMLSFCNALFCSLSICSLSLCRCYAKKVKGIQKFAISPDHCLEKYKIVGFLMRIVGFMPEQRRDDRDEYITVNIENAKTKRNFNKISAKYSEGEDYVQIGSYDLSEFYHHYNINT